MTRHHRRNPFPSLRFLAIALTISACLPNLPAQSNWIQLAPANRPPARHSRGMMAYDSIRDRMVVFGGESQTGAYLGDTWEFDGINWTQRTGVGTPGARTWHSLVFDAHRGQAVLFGGRANSSNGALLADTWVYDGITWVMRTLTTSPTLRWTHAAAYDADRRVVVLFGGQGPSSTYLSDTWEWNGTTWTNRTGAAVPPRRNAAMAYDAGRRVCVLHGGVNAAGYLGGTYEWDGLVWTNRSMPASPVGRAQQMLVYDERQARTILHGGYTAGGANLQDTHEWDGIGWTSRTPATQPSMRAAAGAAYDSLRRRIVMFGGGQATGVTDETWEYRTPQPATLEPFGIGCPGSGGLPTLAQADHRLPWLGDDYALTLDHVAPGVVLVAIGTDRSTWNGTPLPVSLGFLGLPASCLLRIRPDVIAASIISGIRTTLTVPVPASLPLVGVNVFHQAATLPAGGGTGAVTNATHSVIGLR